MSHDKIKAAARARMAQTGEPYSVARRAVMAEHDRRFFPLRFDSHGVFWITKYADRLLGGGPGRAGVWVEADRLRITTSTFDLDVPRTSMRGVRRSDLKVRVTGGVHFTPQGRVLINGSGEGFVEFDVDPSLKGGRGLAALVPRPRIRQVVLSLEDPDGFLAALAGGGVA